MDNYVYSTIASHVTLDDILAAASPTASASAPIPIPAIPTSPITAKRKTSAVRSRDTDVLTPVQRLSSEARAKGYESVCIPLTTDKWRERWARMCLVAPGEGGAVPSPSKEAADAETESAESKPGPTDAEREAEEWRAGPVFRREEVTVTRLDEAEGVTVLLSDWLELDAADDWIRHDAELALHQEIAYAAYLNVHTVILPTPRNRTHAAAYARAVAAALKRTPYLQLSVRLPIYVPPPVRTPHDDRRASVSSFGSVDGGGIGPGLVSGQGDANGQQGKDGAPVTGLGLKLDKKDGGPSTPILVVSTIESRNPPAGLGSAASVAAAFDAAWELWDTIRTVCAYDTRLTLTLDLALPLPTTASGALRKWAGEPVRYLFLPSAAFIANTKGYPVLPKSTQGFIRDMMPHRPTVILSGAAQGLHAKGGEVAYTQYVRHLEKTSPAVQAAKRPGTVEHFAQGYQDYLQAPLQPLMDNLQSVTYQTFEQDPIKYRQYEEAMFRAIQDWPVDKKIVFCVAGAGRGPLVHRCLIALERARPPRKAQVYAVEKNPNAFVTLQRRKAQEWGDKVQLLFGDMRFITVPEPADILVSELLGSFGDNELSPECLDGAMRFLKPNGISIPASYTAHLAPLSSSKLFTEARAGKDEKGSETPYVVMFQAVSILSGSGGGLRGQCGPPIQECWEFEHPRHDVVLNEQGLPLTNTHNARTAKLAFHIPHAGMLHGFAGYFEAVLYGNIGLSIHAERKDSISKDMLSWFPLFFPLKEPLYLPSNSELHVSIWRLTDERKVWYEWYAEAFMALPHSDGTASPASPTSTTSTPVRHRSGSQVAMYQPFMTSPSPSPGMMGGSPMMDAIDSPTMAEAPVRRGSESNTHITRSPERLGRERPLVKIGQTSLHNPGGRSSWIGL
ncbi:hypothetical protein HGRIS_003752 [Hohenbuehelia grisea]|uniref:Protein arginine N-methyltransferase n=1 Tax=Hohenbuehelia grisea TaxID=104357 RepID=A0ABR3JI00_9AGAR